MPAFYPFGTDGYAMHYYQVPLEVMEDMDQLAAWASKSIEIAMRKKKGKKR